MSRFLSPTLAAVTPYTCLLYTSVVLKSLIHNKDQVVLLHKIGQRLQRGTVVNGGCLLYTS